MKQYYDVDEKGAYSSDTVVYGLEDFPLEQIEVYEGEKDLKAVSYTHLDVYKRQV